MTMNRRDFLRMGGFLTVSTATVGLTGCFHDEDDETAGITTPEASGSNWAFPQSVASADPKPDSIVLWTRVTPSGSAYVTGNTSANLSVRLVVSADSANAALLGQVGALLQGTQVTNTLIPAYAKYDGSIRHKLTGLTANKVYYYQFVAGNVRTKIGRFKTAPAAAATPSQLKFAFMSCQDWNSNHWGAFQDIVSKDIAYGVANSGAPELDFVVHLGDYIYETTEYSSGSVESKHSAQALPNGNTLNGVTHAATLADYRYLYKIYRSDVRIQAFHERFPIIAVWDDHEFSDDSYGNAETYTNANTKQSGRRQAANQAWFEFMPADIAPLSEDLSTFQTIKIYRDLQFGTLAHLVMTDERLYRSDHLIPETTDNPATPAVDELGRINSRYLAPEASLKGAEGVKSLLGSGIGDSLSLISVLGQTQRDWWKTTLSSSTSTWKLWGNEVSLLRMGVNGTDALATLLALGSISTLATNIANTSESSTGGNLKIAAAIVTAVTTGASQATAGAAGIAIAGQDAGTDQNKIDAAVAAGLTTTQATLAVTAYNFAKAAAAASTSASGVVAAITEMVKDAAITQTQAITAALAIAGSTGNNAARVTAAMTAVPTLTTAQATTGVTAFVSTVSAAGAQPVTFNFIKPNIQTNKSASPFFTSAVAANPSLAGATAFFQKFLYNADQWDGYQAERKNLMNHLVTNNIQNVVALTGDIHAFFAGPVYNDYAGEVATVTNVGSATSPIYVEATAASAGTAAMVDLVTAGISSSSWFSYLKDVVSTNTSLSALGTLVFATAASTATGLPFDVVVPVLEFALGKPFTTQALTDMVRDALKKAVAQYGAPEGEFAKAVAQSFLAKFNAGDMNAHPQLNPTNGSATANAIASALIADPSLAISFVVGGTIKPTFAAQGLVGFTGFPGIADSSQLQGLCSQLAAMNANPWLSHLDTDAQGYAVVTLTSSTLTCQFHHVNHMLNLSGSALASIMAPGEFTGTGTVSADNRPVVSHTTTITVNAGSAAVTTSARAYN